MSKFVLFLCEILLVYPSKCPWNCFSSNLCFLVISVLLIIVSLFLVSVISLSTRFCMKSSSRCIDASTLFSMLVSPLHPSFLGYYSLSTSSLGRISMVISFLSIWSISLSFSLVHFKNVSSILRRGQPRYLSLLQGFCYLVWFRVAF